MQLAPRSTVRAARRGYTLIEIMIALAIVAILASLAVPTFFESIRKGRRSEAFAALTSVQQAQERRRANASTYTSDLSALGLPTQTANGHYTIEINAASATGFTVTATAAGTQANDTACNAMRVQLVGAQILYGSACKTCELSTPMTDANRCWSRQ